MKNMATPLIAKYAPRTTTPPTSHKENLGVVQAAKRRETSLPVKHTATTGLTPWRNGGKS